MKLSKLLLQLVHAVMDHFANINDLLLRLAQGPHLRGSLIHLVKGGLRIPETPVQFWIRSSTIADVAIDVDRVLGEGEDLHCIAEKAPPKEGSFSARLCSENLSSIFSSVLN
ncbi:hypothetical protein Focb16_v011241 [Fusarium oxysporum f. sp. cubense]|uniref:Uncharacterized protein n=1 Tax=Fusarium oxysporum f. sp. cubense TaxID=61366 RepID=A0A559L1V1_FUSOC|nr:hypothetical protein Focb16_v011241 [Fusarium oxysporum f. sp. cubense]